MRSGVTAWYTVSELEQRHHRDVDFIVSRSEGNILKQAPGIRSRTLGSNRGGRVENYSDEGGSSDSR